MARQHGLSGYRNGFCRCPICREAHAGQRKAERVDAAARLREDPTLAEHGNAHTYSNWGCRCEPCTADHSARGTAYKRSRREQSTH